MSTYRVTFKDRSRDPVRLVEADDFWVSPSGALIFWHPSAKKNKCAISGWESCDLIEETVDDNHTK